MKNKISKKTLLSISSIVLPTSVIVPLTISCSYDDNSVANSSVQLPNDLVNFLEQNTLQVRENQNISAKAFFAEATNKDITTISNSEEINITGSNLAISTFEKYTNMITIKNGLKDIGYELESNNFISLKLDLKQEIISLKTNIKQTRSGEMFVCIFNIREGFITVTETLSAAINLFQSMFSNSLNASQNAINQYLTSEDVWNIWFQNSSIERNSNLLKNFVQIENNSPYISVWNEIINNGKTNFGNQFKEEIYVGLSNFSHGSNEDETISNAEKVVSWNKDTSDTSNKGKILNLNFYIKLDSKEKNITISVRNYKSFDEKIDYIANTKFVEYLNSLNVSYKNNTVTAYILDELYKRSNSLDDKKNIISQYINNIVFDGQTNEYQFSFFNLEYNQIEADKIKLKYNIKWNTLEKEATFVVDGFINDQLFILNKKNEIQNCQYSPTQQAIENLISSKDVFDNWQSNASSIYNYVNGLPVNLYDIIVYNIENVSWDSEKSAVERGSELSFRISFTYKNETEVINNLKASGFITPYSKYQSQFANEIQRISNEISITDVARTVIIDRVNDENYSTYISGVNNNNTYEISNISFEINDYNGRNGILKISITYNWYVNELDLTLNQTINKTLSGFKSYEVEALENYTTILNSFVDNNYMNNIIKQGERYSNWFSSYFATEANYSNYKEIFSRLWNIPIDVFGVDFIISNIKYSKTDTSLTDTQLKFDIFIQNLYANNNNTARKTFVIDGFLDPYDSFSREIASKSENSDLNNGSFSKWNDVPSYFKDFAYGTHQSTWANWWRSEPYSYFYDGNASSWLQYFRPVATTLITSYISDSTNSLNSVSNVSVSWINGVNQRIIRGNYDNGGVCVTTTYVSFTINSNKSDSKGNSAEGKYNPLNTKKLRLYYYFKNGYWK